MLRLVHEVDRKIGTDCNRVQSTDGSISQELSNCAH